MQPIKYIITRNHHSVIESWGMFNSEEEAATYRDTKLERKFQGYDEFAIIPVTVVEGI